MEEIIISRKEKENKARSEYIINIAKRIFAIKGYHATTLDDVAQSSEFGKGTLYNYFESKEALFYAVLEDIRIKMNLVSETSFKNDSDTFQIKIEKFVKGSLKYFFDSPIDVHLLMRESHHIHKENPIIKSAYELTSKLSSLIIDEQSKKRITNEIEPLVLATTLIHLLFSMQIYRIFHCMFNFTDKLITNCDPEFIVANLKLTDLDFEVDKASKSILQIFFNGINN
ncbi:MAG: TetR/AcrR family transcriptional regulator [Chlorobiota bacterium]|nr:MAG: TetR/AcrR family transcriptional regulator [Chlorobiota bacterium]